MLLERLDPGRPSGLRSSSPVDQQHRVGRRLRGEARQRTLRSGIRRRIELELDQSPRGEEREVGRVAQQLVPVEAALDEMDLAVGVAGRTRSLADGRGRLGDQQWLDAGDRGRRCAGPVRVPPAGRRDSSSLPGADSCARRGRAVRPGGMLGMRADYAGRQWRANGRRPGTPDHAPPRRPRSARIRAMKTPARRRRPPHPLPAPSSPTAAGGCASRRVHEIYWEECGNPQGKPAVFVHGGPGAGAGASSRRFFDPQRYRIVLFDQRGCGRSRPHASLEDNTTWHLVADIERLREHPRHRALAGVRRLVGLDAGARLRADAPARVSANSCCAASSCCASGRSTGSTRTAPGAMFPDRWEDYVAAIPPRERGDLVGAYYRRLTSPNRATRVRAARAWSVWEAATSYLHVDESRTSSDWGEEDFAVAFARIECHYFVNKGFLRREDQLLRDVAPDPPHPGRHRAGPLRRRVPDAHRLGPAPALAGGRLPRRPGRRPFGVRARQHARARERDRPLRAG